MNIPKEEHVFDFLKTTSERKLLFKLDMELSMPKEQKLKQLYAHEIGHLVGLVLNNIQCDPFGIPTRISFKYRDAIFKYKSTDGVFCVLSYEVNKDFYV